MAKKKRKKPARSTRKAAKSKTKKRSKAPKKRKVRPAALTRDDGVGAPDVAVVSEAAARALWPGEEPLGRRFKLRGDRWIQVVGVAGNVRGNVLITDDPRPVIYLPSLQSPSRSMSVVVRSAGDPAALAPLVQREVASLDSRLAAGDVMPMAHVVMSAVSPQSATARTLTAAALIALFMAAAGTYGVMAYSVAQRTQEIGVRVALGATPGGILRMVLGQAMLLAGTGLAFGVAGALAMGRGMQSILAETNAFVEPEVAEKRGLRLPLPDGADPVRTPQWTE